MVLVKTQRNQMPKKITFFISYDMMLEYVCAKKKHKNVLKKYKFQEMIEIISNFYEFFNIY
jgi:hypothetical protein